MKKIVSLILTAILLTTSFQVFASEIPETVEISFKVGDSVLSINGQLVEVKAPCVVGEGTTLVPLRVITEAFGCKVDWDDATQGITITYPDVTIKMQIGNINVTVNDHTETLLAAPVLDVDTTMVPLRFISETFGADVGYDDATGQITVTKTTTAEGSTITGITDKSRIGDSYYGWSMDTPTFSMTDRDFDGSYTDFSNDEMFLTVFAYPLDAEVTFDSYFADIKSSYEGYTLTRADKLTDEFGNRYMYFSGKDKEHSIDIVSYFTKKYNFELALTIDLTSEKTAEYRTLIDSFKCTYGDASATYDLSNVASDGTRTYTNKEYNYSLSLPATWDDDNDCPGNEMYFSNAMPDNEFFSTITMNIYSKNAELTAETLAKSDYAHNTAFLNTKVTTVSEVQEYAVNSTINGYAYSIKTKSELTRGTSFTDIFFEYSDYVYNISFTLDEDEKESIIKTVLDSLKVEKIDFDTVGIMLRNDPETDITVPVKVGSGTFNLNGSWEVVDSDANVTILMHRNTGSILTIGVTQDIDTSGTTEANYLKKAFDASVESISAKRYIEIVEKTKSFTSNKFKFFTATYLSTESENSAIYSIVCSGIVKGDLYAVSLTCGEKYYSNAIREELMTVINSLSVK